jgi:branched-chain amino acid transport system ATP-binding protein
MEKRFPEIVYLCQAKALQLKELHVNYGPVPILRGVSLNVNSGEITTLLGANGAGKTTTLKAVYGLIHPSQGEEFFFDEPIIGLPPYRLVDRGMAFMTEEKTLFGPMSVIDNLTLGGYCRRGRDKKQEREQNFATVFSLFPVLQNRMKQKAGTLSGGEQQMLAMGMALMANPKLLLLDEPSLGLAPLIIAEMMRVISELKKKGLSLFLIEQNARAALTVADRGYVMEGGKIVTEGTAAQLLCDDNVRSAYLGGRCDLESI